LRKRIERLDPSVLGASAEAVGMGGGGSSMGGRDAAAVSGFARSAGGTRGAVGAADPGAASVGPEGGQATGRPAAPAVSLSAALAQLGQPTAAHLAFVQGLLAGIPASVRSAAHDVEGTRALLMRLLLARDADV